MLQILATMVGLGAAMVMVISLIAELETTEANIVYCLDGPPTDYLKAWAWVFFILADLLATVWVNITLAQW